MFLLVRENVPPKRDLHSRPHPKWCWCSCTANYPRAHTALPCVVHQQFGGFHFKLTTAIKGTHHRGLFTTAGNSCRVGFDFSGRCLSLLPGLCLCLDSKFSLIPLTAALACGTSCYHHSTHFQTQSKASLGSELELLTAHLTAPWQTHCSFQPPQDLLILHWWVCKLLAQTTSFIAFVNICISWNLAQWGLVHVCISSPYHTARTQSSHYAPSFSLLIEGTVRPSETCLFMKSVTCSYIIYFLLSLESTEVQRRPLEIQLLLFCSWVLLCGEHLKREAWT